MGSGSEQRLSERRRGRCSKSRKGREKNKGKKEEQGLKLH